MKRSQINNALKWANQLLDKHGFKLPEYAYWTVDEWRKNKARLDTVRAVMLGWDVTDYGLDDYDNVGGVLYTIRNGDLNDKSLGALYAEKFILLWPGQKLPTHFHTMKTEDIINKAGGVLWLKLYNAKNNDDIDYETDVNAYMDGIRHTFKAGELVKVYPGQSITLTPRMYHTFGALEGEGDLIVGEVSSINDDNTDNHFNPSLPRFSQVEEDEEILLPLCNEYDRILKD